MAGLSSFHASTRGHHINRVCEALSFWKLTWPDRGAGGLPWQLSSDQRKESRFRVQTSLKAFLRLLAFDRLWLHSNQQETYKFYQNVPPKTMALLGFHVNLG